jgi:hypothetical protein
MDNKEELAKTWVEALQQMLGVTWAQAVAWLGPGVTSLWFWTATRTSDVRRWCFGAAVLAACYAAGTSHARGALVLGRATCLDASLSRSPG